MALQFYNENAIVRTRNLFPKKSLEWILSYIYKFLKFIKFYKFINFINLIIGWV